MGINDFIKKFNVYGEQAQDLGLSWSIQYPYGGRPICRFVINFDAALILSTTIYSSANEQELKDKCLLIESRLGDLEDGR